MIVPDLKNGFIINAREGINCWQTFIESCLIKVENGEEKASFLATPCRAEAVSPRNIFSPQFYEVALAYTWDGPYVIRSKPAMHLPLFQSRIGSKAHRYGKYSVVSDIVAPMVPVKPYSFADLLAELQSPDTNRDNFIYMTTEWEAGDSSYKLINPCRYINFPHPDKGQHRYIQPISGNALVEYNDRFYLSYISAHVTQDGTARTELLLRDRLSILRSLHRVSGVREAASTLVYAFMQAVTSPFSYFLMSDDYCRIIGLDARCTFFTYHQR